MKFRYKVLLLNLILLSLSLSVVGYLMIRKNFVLAKDTQLQNAIVQNNLLQSSVEYELLQFLNNEETVKSEPRYGEEQSDGGVKSELPHIGKQVAGSLRAIDSVFYIRYGENYLYFSDGHKPAVSEKLFKKLNTNGKNYVITSEKDKHYIYMTSFSKVQEQNLYIITKSDISEAYMLLKEQTGYFRIMLVIVSLVDSLIMYLLSMYLTRPLEQLNQISERMEQGDYQVRAEVHTKDEIGLLAEKFNLMAGAVAERIEELNDMIRRRDQFVADFTHEIKTPMTTIIGYADTMRSMELPREEEIMALSYIFSEGKRLESMSQKLFELIYLKQHEIEKKPIHLTDMAAQIVKIVTPAMEQKSIQIVSDISPAVIEGNQELLVTAFINLMDNARKASEEKQTIVFQGKKLEETDAFEYELAVIDYGIGMTKEETQKICDEFYMIDKSRARKEGGAGIGMSLVAMILERHDAQLLIDSEPGNGTKMRVQFPAASRKDTDK